MTTFDLKSYAIENYKSITDTNPIKTDGISIILGPNSSGKTNLLESLILLKQSMSRGQGLSLKFNGELIKLGNFEDVVYNQDTSRDISYKFHLEKNNARSEEPLECPICHKGYKSSAWFNKHFKREHPDFWRRTSGDIDKYTDYITSDCSVTINYTYSEKDNSNRVKSIVFDNPPSVGGLFSKKISLELSDSGPSVKVFDMEGEEVITIETEYEGEGRELPLDSISSISNIVSNIGYKYLNLESRFELSYSKYNSRGKDETYTHIGQIPDKIISGKVRIENRNKDTDNRNENETIFTGFLTRLHAIVSSCENIIETIKLYVGRTNHVGPLRRSPQRIYFGNQGRRRGSSFTQETEIEQRIFRDAESGSRDIIKKTNEWLDKTGFNCNLVTESLGVSDLYQMRVVEESGLTVNLADSGFGLSQTLPIIIECVSLSIEEEKPSVHRMDVFGGLRNTRANYNAIIEQPEIHLNPKIEAALADFFISVTNERYSLLIETHSEHLLNRMQRRVAEGEIDSTMLQVYFVTKSGADSNVREISIDSGGRFDSWPEGFFQDDLQDAVEMLKNTVDAGVEE